MTDKELRGLGSRIPAYSRFIVGIPVLGLFVGSVVLVLVGAVDSYRTVMHVIDGTLEKKEVMVEFIELADIFLLATVLYVIALGLYELFVDNDLPLPKWLEIRTLEDLDNKLIGVVVVVMAVLFLGSVISLESAQDLAYQGLGIAAIIAALAYFLKQAH